MPPEWILIASGKPSAQASSATMAATTKRPITTTFSILDQTILDQKTTEKVSPILTTSTESFGEFLHQKEEETN